MEGYKRIDLFGNGRREISSGDLRAATRRRSRNSRFSRKDIWGGGWAGGWGGSRCRDRWGSYGRAFSYWYLFSAADCVGASYCRQTSRREAFSRLLFHVDSGEGIGKSLSGRYATRVQE